MRLFLMTLIFAGALSAGPASALVCYELALKDADGKIIPVSPPAVGLMLNNAPVIEGNYPPHVTRDTLKRVPCPAKLVEGIRATFNASCIGEEMRKKAAAANNVEINIINLGCGDMDYALQGKDEEPYRKRDAEKAAEKAAKKPEQPPQKK